VVGNYFVYIGYGAAEKNNGIKVYYSDTGERVDVTGMGEGIQCVAEIVQHENGHISLHRVVKDPAWQDPLLTYPLDDADGDGVPDIFEPTLHGIATDPNNANTYNIPGRGTDGDDEVRCLRLEMDLTIPYYPGKDWANPGCQHKNQYGPTVNP
jgi:hypothetical protein